MSWIDPPPRLPLLYRLLLSLIERRLGRSLRANRILAWYLRTAFGAGIMEALVAHDDPEVPRRLLALLRIRTSFCVSCPFCIDMNSREYPGKGITDDEIRSLQGKVPLESVASFSARELIALRYADCIGSTPLAFPSDVIDGMKRAFSPRGMVIVAGTCAQVNFWARLVQSLGVPPVGFSTDCSLLDLEAYATARPGRMPPSGRPAPG
jgi:alkylhydroperoxidase family enzyme